MNRIYNHKVLKLFTEIRDGKHADRFGDGLHGLTPKEIANEMLFYYDDEQFSLLAREVGIPDHKIRDVLADL
jgi:hypothetical protein